MGFDAFFKRHFAVVVLWLLGVAAYFQARGLGRLAALSVALDANALGRGFRELGPLSTVRRGFEAEAHATEASAILARNPFDSVRGPLVDSPVEAVSMVPINQGGDWYQLPSCDGARVSLIVAADDPQWSFATIVAADGKSNLRRQGDELGTSAVAFIVHDRVWLRRSGRGLCQLRLGAKSAGPARAAALSQGAPGDTSALVASVVARIHRVSSTACTVERSGVDTLLEHQAEMLKGIRAVPEKRETTWLVFESLGFVLAQS